ncbi:MAG: vWA domain-containing protein [Geminicoccaceae bacterium]
MRRTTNAAGILVVFGLALAGCSDDHGEIRQSSGKQDGRLQPPRPSPSVAERNDAVEQEFRPLTDAAQWATGTVEADARLKMERSIVPPFEPGYQASRPEDRERYQDIASNAVKLVSEEPVSTFSIDVDTAAYSNVRRFLKDGVLPPVDAVRIEELLNYFDYAYPTPDSAENPFAADIALFQSPWDEGSQLLRIGLKGYALAAESRPKANLVFLVDTSGSMDSPDKLPLLKRSFRLLVDQLDDQDQIAIVAYAGSAGVVLEPTSGRDRAKILDAIDRFHAGGSTAGAEGIRQAYQLAEAGFDEKSINRVILATDGDFNVGVSDPGRLEDFISAKRDSGIYLSILGFGQGNLNDLLMQKLAQAGNGNASYIDSLMEARKVLVDEMGSTLFPIANDVKIQIEFNPEMVAEYRLIGYETRMLARQDFNNDKIDAGEIGSGHTVTALYEITAPGSPSRLVDDLRYGVRKAAVSKEDRGELAWLRMRYKRPGESESLLMERPVTAESATSFEQAPTEAKFAAAVAGFGQLLRQDPHVQDFTFENVRRIAGEARGDDQFGYRSEFLQLIKLAESAMALRPVN